MKNLFFLIVFVLYFGSIPFAFGQLKMTDLTDQQRYLLKFKSVFYEVAPTEDWDAYLEKYDKEFPAPTTIQKKTVQGSERNVFWLEQDWPKLSQLAPHFQIQYLYRFYNKEFLKVHPSNTQFAYGNEFDIRKWLPEGKKRMVNDAEQFPYEKEFFVRGKPMKRSEYDFDNQCFYVTPDFSDLIGFSNIDWPQYHAVPINFIEDYQKFLEKIKIPISESDAELLFAEMDLPGSIGNQRMLLPKLIFSISNEKTENPVYVTGNGYNFHTFFPLKYKPIAIEIEFVHGNMLRKMLHRIEEFPEPDVQIRAIQSSILATEGTPRRNSWVVNQDNEKPDSGPSANVPKNANPKNTESKAKDDKKNDYSFIRLHKGDPKNILVEYIGGAKNSNGSKHNVGLIRLNMGYTYYSNEKLHFPKADPPYYFMAGFWMDLKDKEERIGQYIDKFEIKKEPVGYRLFIGAGPYGKTFKKAGYKNGYMDLVYNPDHTIQLSFFQEDGTLEFTSKLDPLPKNIDHPFLINNK